jgi:dihydrofolate reductase
MGKIILNVTISLDGYISRLDGSLDFITNYQELLGEFKEQVDVIIMGSTTYDELAMDQVYPYGDTMTYVLTSQPYLEEDNVVFTDKEIQEVIAMAKEYSDGDIWLYGGAKTVKQFIDANVIDQYVIHIEPVILGTGIPLFLYSETDILLKLVNQYEYKNKITLVYERDE